MYELNLDKIAALATAREPEIEPLRQRIKEIDSYLLDKKVHRIYAAVEAAVDCTLCGNCCKTLIIDVATPEIDACAELLQTTPEHFKEQYIEESQGGRCFINTIPCHFLADNKCTIYSHRFADCREFPHLHKPGFRDRLSGTLLHYGRCPIIFNTIEELKRELSEEIDMVTVSS